ncbi:hypothetical protein IFM89_034881 [Coptis chinensis]|uniref:Uncharacterized protein n=1 Tax=Coptis chinensis TaxID=261450 RepID=A0A835I9C2_9MAGN|nr:hypothetical protein IFM89_034881 [Coptis chinensis]
MVEAILSAVMDQLVSVIRTEVEQEVRLVVGVREELQNLETKLRLVKAVLEDAEKKARHDSAVKIWLGELEDVMYDADDVLDEWNTRILISANGSHVTNRFHSYLLSMCACFKHVGVRHDIAHRIKGIRERLDVIALNKDQLSLVQSHNHEEEPRQLTNSGVDVMDIYGRDFDKQKIRSMLLSETSRQETQIHVPILSIVGTGGFGKTTLAQLVFNEGTIVTTFELKIWVCVSENFDLNPSIYEAKKLRTLVARSSKPVPLALLTCLRTLALSPKLYCDSTLEVLPSEVSRLLLHLRYLDLSHTNMKKLPETMRSLVNLQTLKLNGCKNLRSLPEGIGELSNLRHLEVEATQRLNYYPRGGIERLRQLRTLSKFIVRDGSKGSVIGELGNLNFLKGRIYITGLKHVKSVNEAKQAELQKKKNISDLVLHFGDKEHERDFGHVSNKEYIRRMEGVLENLEPHKESLERLVIRYYVGFMLPPWMLSVEESVLSNIVDLKLYWCPNLKVLPALGKLQFLEQLWLEDLISVKHLGLLRVGNGDSTSSSSSSSVVLFPKLKKLVLSKLLEWEEEEHDVPTTRSENTTIIIMPRLHKLKISNCPKLKVVPVYLFPPRLEKLVLRGDVGVVSKSLMFLTHNNNLKSLYINSLPHSSLPQGLNQLKSLQELRFYSCKYLDFKPEELKLLTVLRKLEIKRCPISTRGCSREEDWSILTHILDIRIDNKYIKSRN